jgi:hypothetical protein
MFQTTNHIYIFSPVIQWELPSGSICAAGLQRAPLSGSRRVYRYLTSSGNVQIYSRLHMVCVEIACVYIYIYLHIYIYTPYIYINYMDIYIYIQREREGKRTNCIYNISYIHIITIPIWYI